MYSFWNTALLLGYTYTTLNLTVKSQFSVVQNAGMAEVGRDIWKPSGPIPAQADMYYHLVVHICFTH